MPTIMNFNEDQYAATDGTRCIQVLIPDDDSYVPLLAGLLALAAHPENYLTPDSAQAEGVAAIWHDAYVQSDWEGCVMPANPANIYIDLWSHMMTVNAGTYTLTLQGDQVYGFYNVTDTTANRQIIAPVYLLAGSYSIKTFYVKTSVMGIVDLALCDNSGSVINQLATSLDFYGSSRNNILSYTFTISTDGIYQIRLRNQGFKNTSSGGYALNCTCHHIERTGA